MTLSDALPWVMFLTAFAAWAVERYRRRLQENDLHFSRKATENVRADWIAECARNRELRAVMGLCPECAKVLP